MWKPIKNKMWAFIFDDEPESIYVIEGCSSSSKGKNYIVVHEDAYQLNTGETEIMTKEEVEAKYKIKLD
jgi:hypothetical protein